MTSDTNILVIDDEYLSSYISERLIKKVKQDSQVTTYLDGKKAIDKLVEIKKQDVNLLPDYIFVDLFMPTMGGWEFLEQFRALDIDPQGKCKIYILTSSLYPDDVEKSASHNNIIDYLIKPLDFEKLKKIFE
ncbi:MAG TPA: response regulator [Mucilaginibacter sp.]|jgi:response regulator of citrate/malate metabolism